MTPTEIYLQGIRSGMPAAEAFKAAYPNGLPTALDKAKADSKQKQTNGLVQTGGALGGLAAGKAVTDAVGGTGWFAQKAGEKAIQDAVAKEAVNQGATQTAATQAPVITNASRVPGEAVAANGENFWTSSPGTAGTALAAIGTAKGAYDSVKGWENGGEGQRQGLTELGAGLGSFASPIGTVAGAIGGNVLGYGLQGDGWKNDAALVALGPIGWAALGAKKLGYANHKTTKQFEQERWGALDKQGIAGTAASYAANHPKGDDDIWDTGKYAGQKWSFEKANDLAKTGTDFNEVLGNRQVFGNDWEKYNTLQRQAISNGLAQQGLYTGDHGDVLISDAVKAKAIRDQIVAASNPGKAVVAMPQTKPVAVSPKLAAAVNKQNNDTQLAIAKLNLRGR